MPVVAWRWLMWLWMVSVAVMLSLARMAYLIVTAELPDLLEPEEEMQD